MKLLENFWLFDSTGKMHFQIPQGIEKSDDNFINVDFVNKFVQGLYGFMKDTGSKKINSVILEKMSFNFLIIKFEDFLNQILKKSKSKNFSEVKNLDLIFVGKIAEKDTEKIDHITQILDKIVHLFMKLKVDFSLLESIEFSKLFEKIDFETRTDFLSKLKSFVQF